MCYQSLTDVAIVVDFVRQHLDHSSCMFAMLFVNLWCSFDCNINLVGMDNYARLISQLVDMHFEFMGSLQQVIISHLVPQSSGHLFNAHDDVNDLNYESGNYD